MVVDLKMGPFQPEFAGKMNFYLSAINELVRHPGDEPSIGLILCKNAGQDRRGVSAARCFEAERRLGIPTRRGAPGYPERHASDY